MKNVVFAISVALVCFLAACEKKSSHASFELSNLVIREMPPGRDVAVAYLRLENFSESGLTFNYVHSPRAEAVEVHQHIHEDGKMKMREVKHFTIAPESKVDFVPRGYHLMLFGVTERFVEGENVEMTFEFENQEPLTLIAEVKKL